MYVFTYVSLGVCIQAERPIQPTNKQADRRTDEKQTNHELTTEQNIGNLSYVISTVFRLKYKSN